MIRELIGIEDALDVLNRMLDTDIAATGELVAARVPCSIGLALDATIQVGIHTLEEATVGMLGVINGFFGVDEGGNGAIVAEYEVICSDDHDHTLEEGQGLLDACPICGCEIEFGNILKFARNPSLMDSGDLEEL